MQTMARFSETVYIVANGSGTMHRAQTFGTFVNVNLINSLPEMKKWNFERC